MVHNKEFLDPDRLLAREVALWLCGDAGRFPGRITIVDGARSLSHVMVVVPTAQSGRNLRLALAQEAARRGWGALIPPKTAMASQLLETAGEGVATEAEELSAMASVLMECDIAGFAALFPKPPAVRTVDWALDTARYLIGVSNILGEATVLMSEVKSEFDSDRWRDLSSIEKLFFAVLESKGLVSRGVSRRRSAESGCREKEIEEIVLPSAVDIQKAFVSYLENSSQKISLLIHARKEDSGKFDEWGRPTDMFAAGIGQEMIESFPTEVVESDRIARYFRAIPEGDALPALVVCNGEMHPELEGAFSNYFSEDELVLRNPSREKLHTSSLGRLLGAICRLGSDGDYETFSTLARTGDIARWASGVLSVDAQEIAKFVGALDMVQNAHLPRTIDEVISAADAEAKSAWSADDRIAAAGLKRLAEAIKPEVGDPFAFLRKIFASVVLDGKNPADRELFAAAKTVRDLRSECSSPAVAERFRMKLFSRLLKSATYMLEPTAENVLATTGWLEVPWCLDEEMVIAGFNEGCVPENVVGHPFVPDSLRKAVGVATNAMREARDSFIFAQAARCRKNGSVSVCMHQISADKNVMKPSRILFSGIGDKDLPSLARQLYVAAKGNDGSPAKELPDAWRLKLPLPPAGEVFRERISVTALDQYLRCPFNFYLKELFGDRSDDRNQELDAMAFGTLCHAALESFALSEKKDSTDPDEIAAFLEAEVRWQLSAFGDNLPAIVELQAEAAVERLRAFAVHQAERRRSGWRIVGSEQNLQCRIKGCPTILTGKVDRIDRHEVSGDLAIIDYKTWNRAKKGKFDSIQLPAYRAMVEASNIYDPIKAHSATAFYCILAERPEDVMFDEGHLCHEGGQSEAEDKMVGLLTSLARGIFYPPKKDPETSEWVWRKDYGFLVWESPEKGVHPGWIEDQLSRMEGGR